MAYSKARRLAQLLGTDGTVSAGKIPADAIDGTKIADNAINSEHYADGSIDTAHIAGDQITNALIPDNAIDSEHYTDGSIDTAHIAADQITSALIADDQIDSEHIVDGSIDLAHMSVNSIDSDQYVDGSIDLIHMSANSIDSDQYVDGSIDTAHIADDQITAAKLANTAVTAAAYGSSTAIPVITVDAQGRLTAASTATISTAFTLAADSGSNDTFNTSETLTFAGTTNEINTTVSNNQIQIGLPDNVTISGNLTVSGDTTTVNTSTLAVEDPLVALATGNNAADAVDIGLYGLYDTSGSLDLYGGLFRDASDSGKWNLFKDLQAVPTTTVNKSGTGYAVGTLIANLEGNVTGNVTGNTSGTALTVTSAAQTAITSVGTLSSLAVSGNQTVGGTLGVTGAITGNLTGNTSGTAATVTGATQTAITSVGTLSALTVTGNITTSGAINAYNGVGSNFYALQVSRSSSGGSAPDIWSDANYVAIGHNASTQMLNIFSTGASIAGTLGVTGAATFSSTIASGYLNTQITHTSTDVTAANSNSTLRIGNTGSGNGVYNAIKFAANQQDMYIMAFNDQQIADRRMGFFLGSVAGDAVADERLSILGNGNVGIGTTSPKAGLHVVGGIHLPNASAISFDQASGTLRNAILLDSGDDMIIGDTNFDDIYFSTGQKTKTVVIKQTTGNVGIGVTSPANKLEVDGHIGFTKNGTNGNRYLLIEGADGTYAGTMNIQAGFGSTAAGGAIKLYAQAHATYPGSVWIGRGAGAAGSIMFGNGGTGPSSASQIQMVINSSGNVGIGTTSPIAPLHVAGNAVIETGSPDLYFATTSASHTNWRIAAQEVVSQGFEIASGTTSAGSNAVSDTYTTRFVIKNSGNVGIGTTSPDKLLEVSHAAGSHDPVLRLTGSHTGAYAAGLEWQSGFGPKTSAQMFSTASGSQGGEFWINVRDQGTNALVRRMYINNAGNVTPGADNTQDLGASTSRWRNIYTADLGLSNKGGQNVHDGTWGDYTIQEGEDDLFLVNNRNNKIYKFNLTEVGDKPALDSSLPEE